MRDNAEATAVLGQYNRNLKEIEKSFSAKILARGETIRIEGRAEEVEQVRALFEKLLGLIEKNHCPSTADVRYLVEQIKAGAHVDGVLSDVVRVTHWGEEIRAKTVGQHRYVQAVRDSDVVFAIGPAGTGKTFLAVAAAVEALKQERVDRIIVTRPAVEAGEKLGYLPGDLAEKVDPYLQPIWDAFRSQMSENDLKTRRERRQIEVAPLAFMRGRTLSNAFVIVDEAQNATVLQMKMVLTRLGEGSRMVVTGDPSQIDLLRSDQSGLAHAISILEDVPGVDVIRFAAQDVVRHRLVAHIVEAYHRDESRHG